MKAVALMDIYEAESESEMTALSAQKGDICIRNDVNKTFILKTEPASVVSNWVVMRTPTDNVLSVNGKIGNVSLSSQDLSDGDDLVHKQDGKDLSTNDYTDVEKSKLAGIENNAQKNVQSDWSSTDTNSNEYIKNKPTIPSKLSQLNEDSTHRFVTDAEKSTWNNKSDFGGSYNSLTDKPVANTSHTETLGTEEAEEFSASNPLNLHKISKTGRYDDLIGKPTIPDGVELVDNLTSTDTKRGLTANQGKVLNDKVTTIQNNVTSLQSDNTTNKSNFSSLQAQLEAKASQSSLNTTNSNVTANTNSINSLANKGLKLLWTNPSQINEFSAQTITLSSDDYDYLICIYNFDAANLTDRTTWMATMSLKGYNIRCGITGRKYAGFRILERNSNTSFSAGTGYYNDSAGDKYCVPIRIYGGKF